MYQSHWGLRETPFRAGHDPSRFHQSPTHEEALARLAFLVDEHRRVGLLMGPPGSGKSLAMEVFAGQVRQKGGLAVQVSLLGIDPRELLAQLATQLGRNLLPSASMGVLWRAVTDAIRQHRYEQLDTVVLLDDADLASRQVLVQVTRLVQHDWSPEARLTLVLAGRQERMNRLGETLLDLAELRIDLEAWEPADTEQYVETSLAQAGCASRVFAPPALARLHELARGIPRRVSQLADLALLAAAGQELREIDAELVESVFQQMGSGCL